MTETLEHRGDCEREYCLLCRGHRVEAERLFEALIEVVRNETVRKNCESADVMAAILRLGQYAAIYWSNQTRELDHASGEAVAQLCQSSAERAFALVPKANHIGAPLGHG